MLALVDDRREAQDVPTLLKMTRRRLRLHRQEQLGTLLGEKAGREGPKQQTVSGWERGSSAIGEEWLPYVAEVVGMDEDVLRALNERPGAEPLRDTVEGLVQRLVSLEAALTTLAGQVRSLHDEIENFRRERNKRR